MPINYVNVEENLQTQGCSPLCLTVLDNTIKDCTIMRAQLKSKLSYDSARGPFVIDDNHDDKCKRLLEIEKSNTSDVVIFPEYCISYELVDEIVKDANLQPNLEKLWCLPCQGIAVNNFITKMTEYQDSGAIVIDDAYNGLTSQDNKYINALIYCFKVNNNDGDTQLILIPQIKTQAMGDRDYECEAKYMYLGNTIFVFGNNSGIGILSLLCADSLNKEISWDDLSSQARNLILLHPQLNTNTKQEDFRRIRNDMFSLTEKQVYISCNWAKNTEFIGQNKELLFEISDPWSCIYYKYNNDKDMQSWHTKSRNQIEKNTMNLLYSGFLKGKKVAVWYAHPSELAQKIILQKPFHRVAAVASSDTDVVIVGTLIWDGAKWVEPQKDIEIVKRKNHYDECLDPQFVKIFETFKDNEKYNYPFVCTSKDDSDSFFELVLAKEKLAYRCVDADENVTSPTLILNNVSKGVTQFSLRQIKRLISQLESNKFPKHLECYSKGHHFNLVNNDKMCTNLSTTDGENKMIVAVAEDETGANMFITHARDTHLIRCSSDSDSFPYHICVYVEDLALGEYECYPKFEISTSTPERTRSTSDITIGGSKDD